MKVGDLVYFKGKHLLVVKEYAHLWNLQEVGSDYPPSIIDKGLLKIYIETKELKIISKSLNKS